MNRQSQNQKLAAYMLANPNRWLPMPELARVITPTGIGAPVHSRISDLRIKLGMSIPPARKTKDPVTGQVLSEYMLLK